MSDVIGYKLVPRDAYRVTWEASRAVMDVLLPPDQFVVLGDGTVDEQKAALAAALGALYPAPPGTDPRFAFDWVGGTGARVFRVDAVLHPILRDAPGELEELVPRLTAAAPGAPDGFLVALARVRSAGAWVREVRRKVEYARLPFVFAPVPGMDGTVWVRPSAGAPSLRLKQRAGRAAAAAARAEAKRVKDAEVRAHWAREEAVTGFDRGARSFAGAVLNACPALKAVGGVALYRLAASRLPGDEKVRYAEYRTRHAACAVRAAVAVARRLGAGAAVWALPEARACLARFEDVRAQKLWADPKYHPVHADDRAAVVWFEGAMKRVARAARPNPPVEAV